MRVYIMVAVAFVVGGFLGSWITVMVREPFINRRYHDLEKLYRESQAKSREQIKLYEDKILSYENKMRFMEEIHPEDEDYYNFNEDGWDYWNGDTRKKDRK